MNNLNKIICIIKDLRKRNAPWNTVMTRFLKECELYENYGGWDAALRQLTQTLKEEDSLNHTHEIEDPILMLISLYKEYVQVCDKSVFLQKMTPESLGKLIFSLESIYVQKSDFSETYPLPLPSKKLYEATTKPTLVEASKQDNGLLLVFCSKKETIKREEIKLGKLDRESIPKLNGYDKIMGYKSTTGQFYDVVFLNLKHSLLEIRLDSYERYKDEDKEDGLVRLVSAFHDVLEEHSINNPVIKSYVDFFPLVDKIYNSPDEGKVTELYFLTDEGLSDIAKMRRGGCDLRKESFHKAGYQAVHHINPYRISVTWELEDTKPQLQLRGRRTSLSNPNLSLNDMEITNCLYTKDYDFILKKISQYLN